MGRAGAPDLSTIRVLVVDDDDDARDLLRTLLEGHGATVLGAASVAEALEVLANGPHPIDVLVSDIAMPEQDGYALVRRVREGEQAGALRARLPAIAVTAYAGASDRARALEAGFDLHFAKPVDLDALSTAIASFQVARAAV